MGNQVRLHYYWSKDWSWRFYWSIWYRRIFSYSQLWIFKFYIEPIWKGRFLQLRIFQSFGRYPSANRDSNQFLQDSTWFLKSLLILRDDFFCSAIWYDAWLQSSRYSWTHFGFVLTFLSWICHFLHPYKTPIGFQSLYCLVIHCSFLIFPRSWSLALGMPWNTCYLRVKHRVTFPNHLNLSWFLKSSLWMILHVLS